MIVQDKPMDLHRHSKVDVLVVIPVKNEESFIKNCLTAVCHQDYIEGDIVIVVVDNSSTDRSVEYVKSFSDVQLLHRPTGTIGSIRNYGSKFLDSKYIAFLDGDSVPPANWLSAGINLLQQDDVSCVGFAVSPPDATDTWVTKTWHAINSGAKYTGTRTVDWLSSFNLIIDRTYFVRVGGFDEKLETCEDVNLGLRLSKISNVVYSDEITVKHMGVVKTLKEFFLKELWRGQSNWQNFKINFFDKKGILNTIVPLIYLCSVIGLLTIVIFTIRFALILLFILIVIPFLFVIYKANYSYRIYQLPMLAFLAAVYLVARGLAILVPLKKHG